MPTNPSRCGAMSALVAWLALGVTLSAGCDPERDIVRLGDAHLMYDGEPYGDFVVLGDAVRECMGSENPELPNLRLVDRQVECRTADGWQWVLGCEGEGGIVVVAPVVLSSKGSLWAHELTHFFGDEEEDNPCGALHLFDFSLAPLDTGAAGEGPGSASGADVLRP